MRPDKTAVATLIGLVATGLVVIDSPMDAIGRLLTWTALIAFGVMVLVGDGSGHGVRQDWLQVLLAMLALPIAAGYLIVHAIESSPGATAVGFVATAAWLVVLMASSYRILHRAHLRGRIAAIPVALLAAQFVVMPVGAGTAGAHAPRIELTTGTPAGAVAVVIEVDPTTAIHGWYWPSGNGAAVIVLPGAGGNRASTLSHATVLARNGYGVLALDARGSGTSTGYSNLWGWDGDEDTSAALNWLQNQPNVEPDRLGLVGLSMGGEQALTAAAGDHRVHAVVAEGVTARVAADTWYVGDDLRAVVERSVETVMWATADLWSDSTQPASLHDIASNIGVPALIIAADAPDERTVSVALAAISSEIQVWQTSGIGHIQALGMAPAEWEARVLVFLDQSLD